MAAPEFRNQEEFMSVETVKKKTAPPRWDFSDIIIGGKDGANLILKNQSANCDLPSRKDITKEIFDQCMISSHDNPTESEGQFYGKPNIKDFALDYADRELKYFVRFRVSVQQSIEGLYFCMRRISNEIPTLDEQGHHPHTILKLLEPRRQGLVLFSGEMGAGKTSSASAMIKEWLATNGGNAITLEDPPEYKLQGLHTGSQSGFCLQRNVRANEMAQEIPGLMRAGAPNIIFLGEIRDSSTAREVMLAASNGHLVVSTIHGKGVEGALTRIMSLAVGDGVSMESASKIISGAISMVVYQKLLRENGVKTLSTQSLDMSDENKANSIRLTIRENKMEQLANCFEKPNQNRSKI